MKDEIKEILDNWKYVIDNKITVYGETIAFKQIKILLDYITNLQEENENKDNKILELQQELLNKKLNVKDIEYKEKMIYKSRNEKAIDEVIRVLQIILEQPSEDKLDDLWIINRLEGIQILLQGEDK